jgi:hypothetical protein
LFGFLCCLRFSCDPLFDSRRDSRLSARFLLCLSLCLTKRSLRTSTRARSEYDLP